MPGRRRFLQLLAGGAGAGALAVGSPPPALARSPGGVLTPDLGGDVRAALQRALDEAGALGGGTVLVVPGEHRLDGEVVVPSHVTLRGTSRTASRLVGGTVRHPAGVEGASVEDLTLGGGTDGVRYEADGPAGLGATFCIARRLRIVDVAGSGVALRGGAYENLYLEQLWVDRPGRHGIDLDAGAPCRSVFVSEVSVEGPGAAGGEGAAGLRLGGRVLATQVQVVEIGPGSVGIDLRAGSEHTTMTNLSLATTGGTGVRGQDRSGVVLGPYEVERR